MPPHREPTRLFGVDIVVLIGHWILLAAQIIVAVCIPNNTAVIVHIVLVGLHSMMRDTVKVIHWIIREHHGFQFGAIVRAVIQMLQGKAFEEGVDDIVEGQVEENNVQP